jgi:hypothetical protein
MDGWTYAYFEFAGVPVVGAALLDTRPAFVFAADGSRLLWANPAACVFLGERAMGDLLARIFSDLNPIKAQAARLCRLLPPGEAAGEHSRAARNCQRRR